MPDDRLPVVLLHGCGGTARATFETTGMLAAMHRAGFAPLAPDLPGHGPGGHPHEPAAYADMAGMIAPRLPEGPLDAVGYSLGGKLLLELAIRAPGRFRRLVLAGVGDNVFAPETVAEAAASALEHGPTADTPAPVLAFLRTWEPDRNDALAVAAVLRRPPNPVFTLARLAAVKASVLLINGDADPAARVSTQLREALPDSRLLTLPGVDHFGLPGQAGFIAGAVDFLAAALDHGGGVATGKLQG